MTGLCTKKKTKMKNETERGQKRLEHSGGGGEREVAAVLVRPTKLEGDCDAVQELIIGAQGEEEKRTCKNMHFFRA